MDLPQANNWALPGNYSKNDPTSFSTRIRREQNTIGLTVNEDLSSQGSILSQDAAIKLSLPPFSLMIQFKNRDQYDLFNSLVRKYDLQSCHLLNHKVFDDHNKDISSGMYLFKTYSEDNWIRAINNLGSFIHPIDPIFEFTRSPIFRSSCIKTVKGDYDQKIQEEHVRIKQNFSGAFKHIQHHQNLLFKQYVYAQQLYEGLTPVPHEPTEKAETHNFNGIDNDTVLKNDKIKDLGVTEEIWDFFTDNSVFYQEQQAKMEERKRVNDKRRQEREQKRIARGRASILRNNNAPNSGYSVSFAPDSDQQESAKQKLLEKMKDMQKESEKHINHLLEPVANISGDMEKLMKDQFNKMEEDNDRRFRQMSEENEKKFENLLLEEKKGKTETKNAMTSQMNQVKISVENTLLTFAQQVSNNTEKQLQGQNEAMLKSVSFIFAQQKNMLQGLLSGDHKQGEHSGKPISPTRSIQSNPVTPSHSPPPLSSTSSVSIIELDSEDKIEPTLPLANATEVEMETDTVEEEEDLQSEEMADDHEDLTQPYVGGSPAQKKEHLEFIIENPARKNYAPDRKTTTSFRKYANLTNQCLICLEYTDEVLCVTPCDHLFHGFCLDKHLAESIMCPAKIGLNQCLKNIANLQSESCHICLEDLRIDNIGALSCLHHFHTKCLHSEFQRQRHLNQERHCPLCHIDCTKKVDQNIAITPKEITSLPKPNLDQNPALIPNSDTDISLDVNVNSENSSKTDSPVSPAHDPENPKHQISPKKVEDPTADAISSEKPELPIPPKKVEDLSASVKSPEKRKRVGAGSPPTTLHKVKIVDDTDLWQPETTEDYRKNPYQVIRNLDAIYYIPLVSFSLPIPSIVADPHIADTFKKASDWGHVRRSIGVDSNIFVNLQMENPYKHLTRLQAWRHFRTLAVDYMSETESRIHTNNWNSTRTEVFDISTQTDGRNLTTPDKNSHITDRTSDTFTQSKIMLVYDVVTFL